MHFVILEYPFNKGRSGVFNSILQTGATLSFYSYGWEFPEKTVFDCAL